ncbi:uroporphyrinogen-III synthase HEM4 [Aspergillus clavatus NRRL 1]|uniref:Uroporphyrinogen-III synthase (UroS), putative n=1 Tax=Aspergillus clavatus (strain ATCC 1007 / CBS 513.65 / DSM 816 / NCTC 3887 / NRRL 1 / QM 1276 / 107) TaxID=344612 RepID=A1CUC1_ASPCL|nr:uroporphyrinogen-III synthase (UroS), putative [Aspergillus clavatus NRRL 1]EAW06908.1 uroporphyrinogen-III synthase (UroS), putative [Aspergillus clavatus NRRL 1]
MIPSPSYSFSSSPETPILLLKTKSSPHDGYEEFFSAQGFNPAFVPVLEHRFNQPNLHIVKQLFESGSLSAGSDRKYGGLIFTSQRAVEGFARLISTEIDESITEQASHSLVLYSVGPATSRSLTTLRNSHLPHATVHGADAGTGAVLAQTILEHYNALYADADADTGTDTDTARNKPPLLFLVGETHRDIIPKTLTSVSLPPRRRIGVDELIVYGTGVMESFEGEFRAAVREGKVWLRGAAGKHGGRAMWVVVFSPTGCDAMLRVLEAGEGVGALRGDGRRIFVATIGPTTRDHLREVYGFEPDVCAERPSPEGVAAGIEAFMRRWKGE